MKTRTARNADNRAVDPQEHLVPKLDAAIDFSFIYPLVEDLYSTPLGDPA